MIWASFCSIFWWYEFTGVINGCLSLFIIVSCSNKIPKIIGKIMWSRTYRKCKAKQSHTWDISKMHFHMLCVRNLKNLQKNLKKCRKIMWSRTHNNYDTKLTQTVKQIPICLWVTTCKTTTQYHWVCGFWPNAQKIPKNHMIMQLWLSQTITNKSKHVILTIWTSFCIIFWAHFNG